VATFRFESPAIGSSADSARHILGLVRQRLAMGVVLLGQVQGDEWRVVDVDGDGTFPIEPGDARSTEGTLCRRILTGEGPRLTSDAGAVEAFRDVPERADLDIGACLVVPVQLSDGSVYGAICAFDRPARPDLAPDDLFFVEAMAQLVAYEIEKERDRVTEERALQQLRVASARDPLTHLLDHRAWETIVALEAQRTSLHDPATVVRIDLEHERGTERGGGAGHRSGRPAQPLARAPDDSLARSLAESLVAVARSHDVVARLGPSQFGAVLFGCSLKDARRFLERLESRSTATSPAPRYSVGMAAATSGEDLPRAIAEAERMLAEAKAARSASAA